MVDLLGRPAWYLPYVGELCDYLLSFSGSLGVLGDLVDMTWLKVLE